MTPEQFAAFLAALTVGTFLNKVDYSALTPEQKAAYDVKASQVAMAFRAKNPNGVEVHYPIDNINITQRGIAVVVHPEVAPTKNKVFQYASGYVENMTRKAGIPDVNTLNLIHSSSLDDNFLKTTFVVAIKGESYPVRATGEIKTYESTTLRNVDDAIVLGESAKGMLRQVAMDALKAAIQTTKKTGVINRNRITVDNSEAETVNEPTEVAEEQL